MQPILNRQFSTELWNKLSEYMDEQFQLKPTKSDLKLDLGAYYTPNHACIWNAVSNIGRKGILLGYDNKMVYLFFENEDINLNNIFRIEDITDAN